MIDFPNINPVIFSVGPLAISWYSLAYVVGILCGWYYVNKLILLHPLGINKKHTEDFVSWAIISIIIGGRLGYVLFYDPEKYLANPIEIFSSYLYVSSTSKIFRDHFKNAADKYIKKLN